MILHCMKKALWEQRKDLERWGEEEIARAGCVHCSSVAFLWRVAPNFGSIDEPLVLLCIDETKLEAEVRYEDDGNYGRTYPHIYGLVNNDAVIDVLPYLKDSEGNYIKNPQFAHIEDK
ncbi:MAG: DUF952 domain-containing protein [Clostridia bacterium]|nr:DUF952 domain-containing protein [Clostridia bacterium]